ncbi:MAG: coproporphyrinogen III oxidase [Clostridium sp.]|uniref:coproporphyrinogen III oxidase n=1 Tax=Clostridium sp. TaxID=1506 RepID=UPI00306601AA
MENIKAIKIKLNNMNFRYDVFLMVSLFFSFIDIQFVNEDQDLSINIEEDNILIHGLKSSNRYTVNNEHRFSEEVKKAIFIYLREKTGKVLPWGTLVGIRPSKKALDLLEKGYTEEQVIEEFKDRHETMPEKARLCMDVARYEKNIVNKDKNTISIYVGMPFCPTRCVYCSFTSNPIGSCKNIVKEYLESLTKEITAINKYVEEKNLTIESVYFGGGTPTSVNEDEFEDIMNKIYVNFVRGKDIKEFTVECGRADSITERKLLSMKTYKVDRISINPQTMNDETLKIIGRNHSSDDVDRCFKLARKLGFNDINMDMIVGLPGENLTHINNSCKKILELEPDNITIHGMSIKRGSKLYENMVNNKKYKMPQQEELNKMYEATKKLSQDLNMKPYYMYRQKNMVGSMENVGYCTAEKICIYNIQMIEEKQTIIALGADAVSKVVFLGENRIERFANIKDVREYNRRIDEMISRKIDLLNTLY